MILVVTHVDSKTGIPCTQAPCRNGPTLPKITGLKVLWSKTSKNPTTVPEFVCKVPEGNYSNIPGVLEILTEDQEVEAFQQELVAREIKNYNLLSDPLRATRNQLLNQTDIYMVQDYPITEAKRDEWRQYRQALRDVTLQPTFPNSVEWPQPPQKE